MTTREVDAWFKKYDNPMKSVVQAARRVILEGDPRMKKVIKWQAPTFIYRGNLASFYPKSKLRASAMLHVGAKVPGEFPSLVGNRRHEQDYEVR